MVRLRFLGTVAVATALLTPPLAAQTDGAAARELGTTSAEARAEFVSGLSDADNVFFTRVTEHLDRALALDAHYGLARALRANSAAGLTDEQRQAQLDQAVADAAAGSTSELLDILAYRAPTLRERHAVLGALTALAPDNAGYAYRLALTERETTARIAALRAVATRFPDYAPVQNTLAYTLWTSGDHEGAMAAVRQYVKLAPDHPNAHDSYAELQQWNGDLAGALNEYQAAVSLAPDFSEAYAGLAEVQHLTGKDAEARASWQQAIQHAPADNRADQLFDVAGSYVAEGNRKLALQTLHDGLDASVYPRQKATAHAYMAMVEANAGQKEAARAHAAEARAAGEGWAGLAFWDGLLDVYTGDLDAARSVSSKLTASAASGSPAARDAAHLLGSIVAAASGDVATAQAEATAVTTTSPILAQAFIADALNRAGHKADARALRDQVLKSEDGGIIADFARTKVKKL
jgi:tetratricopeptide (TPR) repeat protein